MLISTIRRAQSSVSYFRFRFTAAYKEILFSSSWSSMLVVINIDSLMRGSMCGKLHGGRSQLLFALQQSSINSQLFVENRDLGLPHLHSTPRWVRVRVKPQPTQALPRCTKCNSPPINGQCTNHRTAV